MSLKERWWWVTGVCVEAFFFFLRVKPNPEFFLSRVSRGPDTCSRLLQHDIDGMGLDCHAPCHCRPSPCINSACLMVAVHESKESSRACDAPVDVLASRPGLI